MSIRKEMINQQVTGRMEVEDENENENEKRERVTMNTMEEYLQSQEAQARPSTLLVGNSLRMSSELLPIGTLLV